MASSNCSAANTLLPPQWWALPCCICDISPFLSHRDSAWHADNARFLGTKYWKGLKKKKKRERPNLSLLPHSRPPPRTPPIIMDQRQFALGWCFFFLFVCLRLFNAQFVRPQLNELNVHYCRTSFSRRPDVKQQWVTMSAIFWLYLCWMTLRGRSWFYDIMPLF